MCLAKNLFFSLEWVACGYRIAGLSEEVEELLESCKEEYMEDRGYVLDGSEDMMLALTGLLACWLMVWKVVSTGAETSEDY